MTYQHKEGPLNILCSCRVRLNEEQRQTLKDAHNKFRQTAAAPVAQPVMAGSSVSVETNYQPSHKSYQEFGLSSLITNDLITSRDTVPLPILLKLEQMLEVKVMSREQLEAAFTNYLDYLEVE